jgi:hypothetical protein
MSEEIANGVNIESDEYDASQIQDPTTDAVSQRVNTPPKKFPVSKSF